MPNPSPDNPNLCPRCAVEQWLAARPGGPTQGDRDLDHLIHLDEPNVVECTRAADAAAEAIREADAAETAAESTSERLRELEREKQALEVRLAEIDRTLTQATRPG